MRCVRCDAALGPQSSPESGPSSERCPRCGALVAAVTSAPPFLPDPHGVPVLRFTPTVIGPPVAPEPYLPRARARDDAYAHRRLTHLRMVLPQPQSPPRRGRRGLYVGLSVLLAVLVLAAVVTGVLARDGGLSLWLGLPPVGGAQPGDPTPTATPVCLAQPIDPSAAAALTQATLTTALRDPASQDFRPVDSVMSLRAGQRAYITFQIATARAGTAGVSFCTPTGQIPGALDVPAGSNGHYAQFSLLLDADHTGPGVVTLIWNGAVAASLPFSVVA